MPVFDFDCPICGEEKIDVFCKVDEGLICSKCFNVMKKRCNCHHFKLLYDNKKDSCSWGADGYASSQYWSAVKEARARGEKVKGALED